MTIYAKGDKIRVKLTVDVGVSTNSEESTYNNGLMYSTTQVRETEPAPGSKFTRWTHFLFLNSDKTVLSGDRVIADFDATITGDIMGRPINTTEVTEEQTDGSYGYTHFLYLQSDSVTKLANADGTPLLPEGNEFTDFADLGTADALTVIPDELLVQSYVNPIAAEDSISIRDTEIESSAVLARIAKLEDQQNASISASVSTVVRRNVRPGQVRVLAQFAGIADAVAYIDNEDYDKTRVGIELTGRRGGEAERAELENLKRLNDSGRAVFGSSAWINESLTLFCSGYFDEDWARAQASEELAVSVDATSVWPLSMIDWEQAADYRRDTDYSRIEFDGENYWGVNT